MRRTATALAAVAALSAAPPAAAEFEGFYRPAYDWAADWDCETMGHEGGAVVLTPNAFIGVGSRCSLANPEQVRGMQARLYDATCTSPSGVRTDRIMVLRTPGGMAIVRGGYVTFFASCDTSTEPDPSPAVPVQ